MRQLPVQLIILPAWDAYDWMGRFVSKIGDPSKNWGVSNSRSSSREVRMRVPTFSVVYFSRAKGHCWGT